MQKRSYVAGALLLLLAAVATCVSAQATAAPAAGDALRSHAMLAAAANGDMDTLRTMLASGQDVNAPAADGRTALIIAVESNQPQAVQFLIASKADLDRTARQTGTALNVAENTGQTQIASQLLAAGAHSTGKSIGDTVCVRPWNGDGFCGVVRSFDVRAVAIQVTTIAGCAGGGCAARQDCSASRTVRGLNGLQINDKIVVPSWCLTQTGVAPGKPGAQ